MSFTLDLSLTILIWVLIIFLAAICFMLFMCLLELQKVLQNVREITKIYKDEALPVIEELKNTLANVKNMTAGTNSSLNILKSALTGALGAGALMIANIKNSQGGFFKGLINGFNLFRK